jgi:hypothetical protein
MGMRNLGYELQQPRSVLKGFKYENRLDRSAIRAFIYEISGLVSVQVVDGRGKPLAGAIVSAPNTVLGSVQDTTNGNGTATIFIDGLLPNPITVLKDKIPVTRDDYANEQNFQVMIQAPIPTHL